MKLVFIFCTVIVVSLANPVPDSVQPGTRCGTPAIRPDTTSNIEGGKDAIPYSWPWQAALFWKTNKGMEYHCGATLISNQWLMTGAHCVKNLPDASSYLVKLGVFNHAKNDEPGEEVLGLSEIHMHPNYDAGRQCCSPYDIALLKLSKPVEYSDHISPVCLPVEQDDEVPPSGASVVSIGWGLTAPAEREANPTLRQVFSPLVSNEECNRGNQGNVDEKVMFCAGESNKHACKGDSGGPVLHQDPKTGTWKQIGITAWFVRPPTQASGCPGPQNYNVYTKVSACLDFISKYVQL